MAHCEQAEWPPWVFPGFNGGFGPTAQHRGPGHWQLRNDRSSRAFDVGLTRTRWLDVGCGAWLETAELSDTSSSSTSFVRSFLHHEDGEFLVHLNRHVSGDWGCVDSEQASRNDEDMVHCGRLVSKYVSDSHITFWIETSEDRAYSGPIRTVIPIQFGQHSNPIRTPVPI